MPTCCLNWMLILPPCFIHAIMLMLDPVLIFHMGSTSYLLQRLLMLLKLLWENMNKKWSYLPWQAACVVPLWRQQLKERAGCCVKITVLRKLWPLLWDWLIWPQAGPEEVGGEAKLNEKQFAQVYCQKSKFKCKIKSKHYKCRKTGENVEKKIKNQHLV